MELVSFVGVIDLRVHWNLKPTVLGSARQIQFKNLLVYYNFKILYNRFAIAV
jgi:hypothetical protein